MPRFNDYSISSYGGMVIDERRTRPYVEALKRTVKPGDVVLDIGTGTGFFAFLAAQLGAASGAVRCGTCLKVFSAPQNLVGEPTQAPAAAANAAPPIEAAEPATTPEPIIPAAPPKALACPPP